ncbi:hypothetical protein G7Y79_00046g082640 [Physcia stellaris]|nr:hypothetical protein G7Y79_00046g082640 [Physcia stellaris]
MNLPFQNKPLQAQREERDDFEMDDHVTIPDMFVSFLAQEPRINPHYERVKGESETWIAELCQYSQKDYQKHVQMDFPYFVSIWAREAELEELRTICDWMNWIFDFDDMFDEGRFKDDREQAARHVSDLMNVMQSESKDRSSSLSAGDPLLRVFESVWDRVSQPNEQRFLALRRQTVGAGPCFALIEYFYALDLPDQIFDNPAMQQLDRIAREMIVIQNDALSFPKELAGGIDQNLIALYGHQGMPPQEAYDRINVLLKERYREWYLAQANLPQWGEAIDKQVQKYIRAMQDVITANVYWSFHTTRYFGKNTDEEVVQRIELRARIPNPKQGLDP